MFTTTNPPGTVLGTTTQGPIIQLLFNMYAEGGLPDYSALLLTLRGACRRLLSSYYCCAGSWVNGLTVVRGEKGALWESIH